MRPAYQIALALSAILALVAIGLSTSLFGTELRSVFVLPMGYLVFLAMVTAVTRKHLPSPFLAMATITAFLRYVAFPILTSVDAGYWGRSRVPPAKESFDFAVALMSYELIAVSLLIMVLERIHQRQRRNTANVPPKSLPGWYTLAIAGFAITALLAFPQSIYLLSFLSFGSEFDELAIDPATALAAMIFMSAKVFIATKLIHLLSQASNLKSLAPYAVVVISIVNIFVYFGTNRIAVVLTAIATGWIFIQSFGGRSRLPIVVITISALLAFSTITERREYASTTDTNLTAVNDMIQVYTGGPYNVAIGVEVKDRYPEATHLTGLVFDFLRPTIGFNILLQDMDINYSNIYFNMRMFTHVDRRSQIMPMIAQGNLYFNPILAPLLSLLFVFIGYKLQSFVWSTQYVELKYALLIVVLRLGFFWGQNTMNMMNFLSLNLVIPFMLVAGFFAFRKTPTRLPAPRGT